ncbi:pyridoxine/pyridoxamine 5'-phosphate oxidase [Streptosporangium sp. DT93]|uniref:pyridoxine/pyridoxamine 5'-phosphate oxidase n=1 Tax=Streptosporangium sp. DT93 TaxID=3393428 RepID=UPI003CEB924A
MSQDGPPEQSGIRGLLRALPVFACDLPTFTPHSAPDDPVALFVDWLTSAIGAEVPEPHAMTLSTADAGGRPSARVLICKDVDAAGRWYFASGSSSRKGRELAVNPHAALTFHWPRQGRQIRVRGAVATTGAERSAADFLARSPASRAEALGGRQSQVLDDPAEAEAALRDARARLEADPDLVSADWTLYALTATDVEFWQADERRRHTRLRYERTGRDWTRHLLWP